MVVMACRPTEEAFGAAAAQQEGLPPPPEGRHPHQRWEAHKDTGAWEAAGAGSTPTCVSLSR